MEYHRIETNTLAEPDRRWLMAQLEGELDDGDWRYYVDSSTLEVLAEAGARLKPKPGAFNDPFPGRRWRRPATVRGRLKLEKAYPSDSWHFSSLLIDTAPYRLAKDVRAFGVRAEYSVSSRVRAGWPDRSDGHPRFSVAKQSNSR